MAGRRGTTTAYAVDSTAREQLILQHLPLVHHVIGRLAIGLPAIVDREDLVAHGVIGLIQAIDRFDPTQGVPFGPWASIRIRGAVIDALRALDLIGQSTRHRLRELQTATSRLTAALGRLPNDEEVRRELGVSVEDYDTLLEAAACQIVSLDATTGEDGAPLADLLPGAEDPSDRSATRATIAEAVRHLDRREQLVLSMYYAEGLTLQEIGGVIGVHKTVVVRLHARAIVKLRALLGDDPRAGEPEPPTLPSENSDATDNPQPSLDPDAASRAVARAAGPAVPQPHPGPRLGGRYAGARRAYLSGPRVQLGTA